MPRITLIKPRQDTAANWTSVDPVLAAGEEGIESDTGLRKLGDGATAWTALAYAVPVPPGTYADNPTPGTPKTAVVTTGDQTIAGTKTVSGDWFFANSRRVDVAITPSGVDDSAALLAAVALLPDGGGRLKFLPHDDQVILPKIDLSAIPNLEIEAGEGCRFLFKPGLSSASRGMFEWHGRQDGSLYLNLAGAEVDMNRAAYPDIDPMTPGTPHSLLYAVRSTGIWIERGTKGKNCSDSLVLLRNCADIHIAHLVADNLRNTAVEIKFYAEGEAGGINPGTLAPLPDRVGFDVYCEASDIDDGLLGAGDASGILMGNNLGADPIVVEGIKLGGIFRNCTRGVWVEFNEAASYGVGRVSDAQCYDCAQGGVGVVNFKGYVEALVQNSGTAGTLAAGVDTFGVDIGGDSRNEVDVDLIYRDTRASAAHYAKAALQVNAADRLRARLSVSVAGAAGQAANTRVADINNVSGSLILDSIDAKLTGASATLSQAVVMSNISVTPIIGQHVIDGWTTGWVGLPPQYGWKESNHRGESYEATAGDFIIASAGRGVRPNTADGADNLSTFIAGGGAKSDGRGAFTEWLGNEATGQVSIDGVLYSVAGSMLSRSGNLPGAVIGLMVGDNYRLLLTPTRPTLGADATDLASVVALANAIKAALVAQKLGQA